MDPQYQAEVLGYGEKIALAKLEVSKAEERVSQLEYQLSRYHLEYFAAVMRQKAGNVTPPVVS